MRCVAGVDVGSTQTKAVILAEERPSASPRIMARAVVDTGANVARAAECAFQAACREAGLDPREIGMVVGTGYGRYRIAFGHAQVTEISCHARGAHFIFPETRTVIDIGGQDAKVIRVGPEGDVRDFVMNDKCAAGTGRFLANAAEVLGLSLEEIGPLSLRATDPVKLTTVCTVFVESDILSYLAQGRRPEDILRGVHLAIARRTISLARRIPIEPAVTFTGGVARNIGMVRALEEILGLPIHVSPESHFMGALGAALFALERMEHRSEGNPALRGHG